MSRHPDTAPVPSKLGPEDAEQIRAQLERILASPLFRSGRRCHVLLRQIAERTLAGDTAALKERTLGAEVFGRPADYDTNQDPIVRGTAGEIRKKLAQYYQQQEHRCEIRIALPLGSYVPEFLPAEAGGLAPGGRRWPWWYSVAAGAVVVLAAVAVVLLLTRDRSALDQFWRPMMNARESVLICLPQPRVYGLRSDARQRDLEKRIAGVSDSELAASQDSLPMRELFPMWDRYLAWGDATCMLRLALMFDRHQKPYSLRGAATTFADLRERPAVLIGAFNNEWTLRAVGQLRYTFYKDFEHIEMVRDRDHPDQTDWKLIDSWPKWDMPQDYAIVSRVLDGSTDRMVVIAAGITHFGTMAAGEFLSTPEYFADALSRLPRGWQDKNLQIVLRVPVVHGESGRPQVLAVHTW